MKTLIIITSYQRPEMLNNLINQLGEHDIIVFDDNSDFPPVVKSNVVFHRFEKNYGKKEAWMKFNYIFENVSRDYYYYIVLSDDSKLVDNFVERAIETWESINDDMKICLSFSSIERTKQPCFTGVKSIDKGNVILTQWTDLTFICTKQFIKKINIEKIDKNRWDKDPNLSSGVGSKISRSFYPKYNLYNTKEELVKHIGNNCSLMNTNIRKNNPL